VVPPGVVPPGVVPPGVVPPGVVPVPPVVASVPPVVVPVPPFVVAVPLPAPAVAHVGCLPALFVGHVVTCVLAAITWRALIVGVASAPLLMSKTPPAATATTKALDSSGKEELSLRTL
jgi:hypothetical protein